MDEKKERRGGRRPGAGRPKLEKGQHATYARLNLRISPELFERIQIAAQQQHLPVSTYIRQLIEKNME